MALISLVKSFIVGSSAPVFLPILFRVSRANEGVYNYSYKSYSVIAPLFYGGTSVLITLAKKYFSSSLINTVIVVAILSVIYVIFMEQAADLYNFTKNKEWHKWASRLLMFHSMSYIFMYNLHKLFNL